MSRQPPPPALPGGTSCRVHRDRASRAWIATCAVKTPSGVARFSAAMPEEDLRRLVRADLERGAPGAVSGNIFTDIGRGFATVAKNKAVQSVAAGVLAAYGVPPGITTRTMQLAGNLSERAANGEPRAVQAEERINVQADRGNPGARRARVAIHHARRARRQVALSVGLLEAVRAGGPQAARAAAQLEQIARLAQAGNPGALAAARAIRVVLATGYRAAQEPPPPVVRRAPPPPAVRAGRLAPPPPATAATAGGWWSDHRPGRYPYKRDFTLRDAYNLSVATR